MPQENQGKRRKQAVILTLCIILVVLCAAAAAVFLSMEFMDSKPMLLTPPDVARSKVIRSSNTCKYTIYNAYISTSSWYK